MAAVTEETGGATITATPSSAMSTNKAGSHRSVTAKRLSDANEAEKMQLVSIEAGEDASTPISLTLQERATNTNSKKPQTARKIAMNTRSQLQSSSMKSFVETPYLVQENQAIKRQKLGGKTRQVPQKPEFIKQCTKVEPFQLESLVRHEEEMRRQMEEQLIVKRVEVERRMFKEPTILKEDPIPVTDKVRKPLTQVQEVTLHADNRAVARAQFDGKVQEKDMVCKRFREENEATKMVEEEKVLKQLRRTMVAKLNYSFCPQKCVKNTANPKPPNLLEAQRKERPKISSEAVISSPAARIR